ncbi:hypothetical protein [Arachidicoccus sp.]|uniref:hypothetical protein n=1 Tax=Arachidicoccus sp. TaxID=1872624 RepID=UPI003D251947
MKINFKSYFFFIVVFVVCFLSCGKNPIDTPSNNNQIQQGDSTIEINAIYPNISPAIIGEYIPPNYVLYIRDNAVIDAAINLVVAFYVHNDGEKDISATIPAGYKQLQLMNGNNYINSFTYYTTSKDSLGNTFNTTVINSTWVVDSIKIKSVICSNKKYGFKVLDKTDWTSYYTPHDSVTSINFIANTDTISYSDYNFNLTGNTYRSGTYAFYFPNPPLVSMFSGSATYPLQKGMTIDIPLMVYAKTISFGNGSSYVYYGSQPDGAQAYTNYSTVKMNITNVTDKLFDADFSGKIYSSRQHDTLYLTKGTIKNAPLPTQQ